MAVSIIRAGNPKTCSFLFPFFFFLFQDRFLLPFFPPQNVNIINFLIILRVIKSVLQKKKEKKIIRNSKFLLFSLNAPTISNDSSPITTVIAYSYREIQRLIIAVNKRSPFQIVRIPFYNEKDEMKEQNREIKKIEYTYGYLAIIYRL